MDNGVEETMDIDKTITHEMENETIPDIPTFYKDKTLFITGVTGFLGSVLLCKLLRSCPDIHKIYILLREKCNTNIEVRFNTFIESSIFNEVLRVYPNAMKKLQYISGDCYLPNLGISEQDLHILTTEVNVVFHVAATVKFDSPLKDAVQINIRSTRDLLNMAMGMKHLEAFVYISTAFANCANHIRIKEKLYKSPITPSNLMNIIDSLDDHKIRKITPILLDEYPNTYVYTKAISEQLLTYEYTDLPVVLFRPAIVTSTSKEPIPGWINNTYGPTGIVAAAALGLLRTLHCNEDCYASIVPCDFVINSLITSAWFVANKKELSIHHSDQTKGIFKKGLTIFNFSNYNDTKTLTWKIFMKEHELWEPEFPFSIAMWSYGLKLHKNEFIHRINKFVNHLIPATVADNCLKLCGKKPSTKQWYIDNSNVQQLWSILSDEDREHFNFELMSFDWKEYCGHHLRGIREHILHDRMDTLTHAKRKRKWLIGLHYSVHIIVFTLIFYVFYKFQWLLLL